MSVVVIGEVGYGKKSNAFFYAANAIDGAKISAPADNNILLQNNPWSPWGEDNIEPFRMQDDIEKTGVLSAGIESKVRMALGKGIDVFLLISVDADGNEVLEHVTDTDIQDWLETNQTFIYSYSNIYNILAYGWAASQIILSKDRSQINRISSTDVYSSRLEKRDKSSGIINNIYLSGSWDQVSSYDTDKVKRIQVLRESFELEDLDNRSSGYEFCILHRMLKNGRQYYPLPLWKAAQAWVKVTRAVPEFKKALHQNQMSVKYVITISDTYWKRIHKSWDTYTPEKRIEILQDKYDELDKYLSGEQNQGKSIFAGKYVDPYTKQIIDDITIDVLDDKMKDGKLLPDSAAADKQILFAMFFNPAIWGGNLLGDGASGGAGSGSDIREAFLVQLMLMQAEREMNLKVFNIVKKYNGWAKKYEVPRQITDDTAPVKKSKPKDVNSAMFPEPEKEPTPVPTKTIVPRLVFRYKSGMLTTLDTGKSTKAAVQ